VAILHGDELLAPVLGDADDHQQAPALVQAHVAVDAVDPPVDTVPITELALTPRPALLELLHAWSRGGASALMRGSSAGAAALTPMTWHHECSGCGCADLESTSPDARLQLREDAVEGTFIAAGWIKGIDVADGGRLIEFSRRELARLVQKIDVVAVHIQQIVDRLGPDRELAAIGSNLVQEGVRLRSFRCDKIAAAADNVDPYDGDRHFTLTPVL